LSGNTPSSTVSIDQSPRSLVHPHPLMLVAVWGKSSSPTVARPTIIIVTHVSTSPAFEIERRLLAHAVTHAITVVAQADAPLPLKSLDIKKKQL